jgi:hypothetical protein
MDRVNAREKEKTMVQNLLNLTGVKGASSHSECFANVRVRVLLNPTHLCVDRLHNVNLLLYNMFNLKAPFFKGGWGGSDAIKQPIFPLNL